VRFVRITAVLAAVTTALAVPLVVLAGGSGKRQSPPTFAFGRTGGNIASAKVSIGKDGRVTSTGSTHASLTQASVALRNGLGKLAVAEGLFSMPVSVQCPGVHPDVASRFVTVSSGGKTRTVAVHGTCKAPFEELYAVLSASVGAQ
jgi:hypothetical protein